VELHRRDCDGEGRIFLEEKELRELVRLGDEDRVRRAL
jgi:hypothetical protein